jgi:C4-dicarboxylate-specific signal transduction histidine kinase
MMNDVRGHAQSAPTIRGLPSSHLTSTSASFLSRERVPLPTNEDLAAQLKAIQDALLKSERIAAVAHHAAAAMHEASDPLEIITNLHYLIRHTRHDPEKILEYLEEAETQTVRLLEINGRILRLHREATGRLGTLSGELVM